MGKKKKRADPTKLQCVDLATAKRLEKAGFDWWCRQSYVGSEFVGWMGWSKNFKPPEPTRQYPNHPPVNRSEEKPQVAAPELDLVAKWLRNLSGWPITIVIEPILSPNPRQSAYKLWRRGVWFTNNESFDTYEEAMLAAINDSLDLIEPYGYEKKKEEEE